MSKKREVQDARFRNREHARSSRPKPPSATPGPDGAAPAPSSLPPWLTANVVVPIVMALFLGVAFYEKFGPFTRSTAGADAGGTASPDAASAASPDASPMADGPAAPTRPAPNDGAPVTARTPTPSSPDPLGGRFTLEQATAGLSGTGALHVDIETSLGTFDCTLLEREAPVNVANFVGLARGLRDFWDPVAGAWTKRPFYDGSVFHRVIPEFMIQGGDQLRSGMGETGYIIPDENVRPHDAPGLLCMANKGPGTASAQFFITEVPKPDLDDSYSIFGRCTPTDLVQRIARVPRGTNDRPNTPVHIYTVRIRRD